MAREIFHPPCKTGSIPCGKDWCVAAANRSAISRNPDIERHAVYIAQNGDVFGSAPCPKFGLASTLPDHSGSIQPEPFLNVQETGICGPKRCYKLPPRRRKQMTPWEIKGKEFAN